MRLISLLFSALLTGCSSLHSVTARYDPTTGKLIESTHATGMTFFDANSSLAKFANHSSPTTNGTNVYGAGTYASGLSQASSGSNVVVLVISGAGAVSQGVVQGLK